MKTRIQTHRRTAALSIALILLALAATAAEARGRRGFHPRARVTVTHIGIGAAVSPYWLYPAYAFGPWPYAVRPQPEGGMNRAVARALDLGALDLSVDPKKAEVWVDGEYYGLAKEFDGYPSYLWLDEGRHTVTLYKGGYRTFEQQLRVAPGSVRKLKVDLVPGPSEPPGTR